MCIWMDGRMDGWIDERTDGWTDGWRLMHPLSSLSFCPPTIYPLSLNTSSFKSLFSTDSNMCTDGKCLRGSKMTQCVLCPFAWPHPRHLSCLWELLLLVSKVDFFFSTPATQTASDLYRSLLVGSGCVP